MSTDSLANLQPKKAPLAQAIREFVTAIEFPPCDGDQNFKYSGLILALLQFSGHLTIESKSATCTPSLSTIASLMHCNEKTVRRQITSLEKLGLITSRRRLRKPNVYTVWKEPQIGQQVSTQETEQSEPRLDSRCPDRPKSRLDNPAVLIGQESTPDRTPIASRLDTKGVLIGQQVSNIGSKPIGSKPIGYTPEGNKPEGSESSPGAKDVLSNPNPSPVKEQGVGFDLELEAQGGERSEGDVPPTLASVVRDTPLDHIAEELECLLFDQSYDVVDQREWAAKYLEFQAKDASIQLPVFKEFMLCELDVWGQTEALTGATFDRFQDVAKQHQERTL